MSEEKYTLRDLLRALSVLQEDKDVFVDGTDCNIAVVGMEGIRLTPDAQRRFKGALELEVCGAMVFGEDEDYVEYEEKNTGRIADACTLLYALAGYCTTEDYSKWFEGVNAELV